VTEETVVEIAKLLNRKTLTGLAAGAVLLDLFTPVHFLGGDNKDVCIDTDWFNFCGKNRTNGEGAPRNPNTPQIAGALVIDECSDETNTFVGGKDVSNATELARKIRVIGPDGYEIDIDQNLGAQLLMVQQVTEDNDLSIPDRTIYAERDYEARDKCTLGPA